MKKTLCSLIVPVLLLAIVVLAVAAPAYAETMNQRSIELCNHCFGTYQYSYNATTHSMTAHAGENLLENPAKRQNSSDTYGKRYYYQLDSSVLLSHENSWVLEYTGRDLGGFALGQQANIAAGTLFVWNQGYGKVWIGYVQTHSLTEEEQAAVNNGDTSIATHTWHYWTYDSSLLAYDSSDACTYRIENILSEDGSNTLKFSVYNHDLGRTVLEPTPLSHYYTRKSNETEATLQSTGSTGLAGKDLVINYLGTVEYPLSSTMGITLQEDTTAENTSAYTENRTEPTCTQPGGVVKTCEKCGASETEPELEALGHSFGEYVSNNDASCAANGTKTAVCTVCGEEDTIEDPGTQLEHSWIPATCAAAKTCEICGTTEGEPLPHNWQPATCEVAKHCLDCRIREGEPLGHDWTKATCQAPSVCRRCEEQNGGLGSHDWKDATCTEPKTCTVCATKQGEPKGHRWKDATCTEPKTCKGCALTEGEPLGHTWKDPTCTAAKTCSRCAETEGEPLGHQWTAASCTEKRVCQRCQKKDGEPLGHTWKDATCYEPKICQMCGVKEGEPKGHTWQPATCTDPETCADCDATQGEPLGHSWKKATCTEPKTCLVCHGTEGEPDGHKWEEATCTEAPVCQVCNVSEGEPKGHQWVNATCTSPGTCSECQITQGEAMGHSWRDATCNQPKTCLNCGSQLGMALGHVDVNDDNKCDRCSASTKDSAEVIVSWIIPVALILIVVVIGYIVWAEMRAKKRRYYKR